MKNLLGGKGANLAEMVSLNIPVPPGFTISTEACTFFNQNKEQLSDEIKDQVKTSIADVEKETGKKLGCLENPLLFSVRSGARVSMPGMMDTVLNLGLNDQTVLALAKKSQNPRFAWDSYRRFIQMYSNVVLGLNSSLFEMIIEDLKEARNVTKDTDLTADDLQELVSVFKKTVITEKGTKFPEDPYEQLWQSIGSVFKSWQNARAIKYRQINAIPHEWGTAVNIQSMVFGNSGDKSATGVAFTRDPSSGEKYFFGEYLVNAQGEDVVAGTRTPAPINENSKNDSNKDFATLEGQFPKLYQELVGVYQKLEKHYKDMQDIEFTIEDEKLFLLQTRNGKRTTKAGLKIAVDLVKEGLITQNEALLRISPEDLNQLLHPTIDPTFDKILLAKGLPASPGAATGKMVFTPQKAEKLKEAGEKTILVRKETSPDDIGGMVAAEGILTARGGMTSHAAVVARGMGKPCVAGCTDLIIDEDNKKLIIKDKKFQEGDFITIDGGNGEVIEGTVPTKSAEISEDFAVFMGWADKVRKLKVRTNADTPNDLKVAVQFGAEGIGLCRTEHMFFAPERILAMREMIFAQNSAERKKSLEKLSPFQEDDFYRLFQLMDGKPVNIRLLDPPLHEFLPFKEEEISELAASLRVSESDVYKRIDFLKEQNPMLGHRGCRLGITYPEIYLMQSKAIINAALKCQSEGITVIPEIMIPLVQNLKEYNLLKELIQKEIDDLIEKKSSSKALKYKLGTMIELPRAAVTAHEIAESVEFFSFGTNDLTQTTLGISRDDANRFLGDYISNGIFPEDPFSSIDVEGVGRLVEMATVNGRKSNEKMHVGICGEHGGDPKSIQFFHDINLDYISCSPYRVPIARLSAAQATLNG